MDALGNIVSKIALKSQRSLQVWWRTPLQEVEESEEDLLDDVD